MNELLKIHDHKGQKVVSARELHYYLEVGRDFSTWIKDRIERFEFIENMDFVTFTKIVERANQGFR
ncbi:MAG TPA: antA/AntB antirepressor family protein [Prolixibacteraceae bacterium]|nr:antA/AntB antirepressor family protein [Prolixibacteraceae bacterium]